jgi:hypothetical protein
MSCDSVANLIPLYYYGELSPEEEDRLDAHLSECSACAREIERHRTMAAALDRRAVELPSHLLDDCRVDLLAAIEGGAPRSERAPAKGPWTLFLEALASTFTGFQRFRTPVGALALIAVGFFAARFSGSGSPSPVSTASVSPSDEVFATVRSVQPDQSGRVQIALDETRRRVVSGRMDDANIQRLLLAASHEDNPAVRVESVGLLQSNVGSAPVRDALLNAVAHDPNSGVRLKALEKLKALAGDPEVRKTLSQVLLADDNPAVRMQVVDLLVARRDDNTVGVLQELVQKESNPYLRLKCEKLLKEANASVGTF